MSNASDFADLGLGLDLVADAGAVAPVETPVETQVVTPAEVGAVEAVVATKREEVAIADLEFGEEDFIPALKRGGTKGSKYEFDKLTAPVAKEDGSGFKYSTFLVRPENAEDFDAVRLKRSVQTASTNANATAKDEGRVERYLTRQKLVNGVFVGVTVFRVDGTQDTDAEAADDAAE